MEYQSIIYYHINIDIKKNSETILIFKYSMYIKVYKLYKNYINYIKIIYISLYNHIIYLYR